MKIYKRGLKIVSLEKVKEVFYNGSRVRVDYMNNDCASIEVKGKEEAGIVIDEIAKILRED